MVFDDRNSCASTFPMDQLATSLILNRTKNSLSFKRKNSVTTALGTNSPASSATRKNSVTCKQKIDSSNEAFFKVTDCAPTCDSKKKTVMFTTDLTSCSATSDDCVSRTEHSVVWYTSKELAEISNLAKSARQSALLSETGTKEKDSLRGLECRLSIQANQEMKGRKIGVVLAVLNEQRRQRTIGVSDASRIKTKSKMASRKSRTLAIELAKQDAKEAFQTEVTSRRLTGTGKGLPNYSSPRNNTRTNSLRRLSSFDAMKLADLSVPDSSRKFLDAQLL